MYIPNHGEGRKQRVKKGKTKCFFRAHYVYKLFHFPFPVHRLSIKIRGSSEGLVLHGCLSRSKEPLTKRSIPQGSRVIRVFHNPSGTGDLFSNSCTLRMGIDIRVPSTSSTSDACDDSVIFNTAPSLLTT